MTWSCLQMKNVYGWGSWSTNKINSWIIWNWWQCLRIGWNLFKYFHLLKIKKTVILLILLLKRKVQWDKKSQKSLCRFVLSCYVFILLYEKSYVSWALVPLYCLLLVIVIIIVILVNIDILGQFSFIWSACMFIHVPYSMGNTNFKQKPRSFGKVGCTTNFVWRENRKKNPKKRNYSTLKHRLNAFSNKNNKG